MLKQKFTYWLAFAFIAGLTACSSPDKKVSTTEATKTIEIPDNQTIFMVHAKGKGPHENEATADAEKSAVWYLLANHPNKLLTTPEERRAFEYHARRFWHDYQNYIQLPSPVMQKRQVGGLTFIGLKVHIDRSALEKWLVDKQIIAPPI